MPVGRLDLEDLEHVRPVVPEQGELRVDPVDAERAVEQGADGARSTRPDPGGSNFASGGFSA